MVKESAYSKTFQRTALLCFALLLPQTKAYSGQFSRSARGTAAAKFLKLAVDARGVALGEAYSTIADEASALYWNPAALSQMRSVSASFMHAAYLNSMSFDYLAIGGRLGENLTVAGSVHHFSVGKLTRTDTAGRETGSYSPDDMAISAGGAYRVASRVSAGVSAKFIRSTLDRTAKTISGDMGLLINLTDKARLSAVGTNLFGKMKFNTESEDLPRRIKIGAAYKVSSGWLVAIEEGFPSDDSPYTGLGTEYILHATENIGLASRAGVNTRTIGSIEGINGVAIGIGIKLTQGMSVDYALTPFGALGNAHRVSLNMGFGGKP